MSIAETGFNEGVTEAGGTGDMITIPVAPAPIAPVVLDPARAFTAEDVEAARKQEKDKLYTDLENTKAEVRRLKEVEDASVAAEVAAADALAAAERDREQSEMTAKELIAAKDAERKAEIDALRNDLAVRDTLLAKERQLNELTQHRAARLGEVGDKLLPHLIPFVSGNTPEEVDASIATLVATSDAILGEMQETVATLKRQMPGVSPAGAPPAGPSDPDMNFQTLSIEQLKNMSLADYEKNRPAFLAAASNQFHGR